MIRHGALSRAHWRRQFFEEHPRRSRNPLSIRFSMRAAHIANSASITERKPQIAFVTLDLTRQSEDFHCEPAPTVTPGSANVRALLPNLLEEIRGLAEGARIEMADALACNIRSLPTGTGEGGCTAYAVSRNGTAERGILAGQNSDMDDHVPPLAYVLHLQPRNKPEVLIWTFGGMIGYHGMNSVGLAHFANALGGGTWR